MFPQLWLPSICQNTSISLEASVSSAEYATAILNTYANFLHGFFNYAMHNFAHSKVCTSLAILMEFLWQNHGNTFTRYDEPLPVKSYMHTCPSQYLCFCCLCHWLCFHSLLIHLLYQSSHQVEDYEGNTFLSTKNELYVRNMAMNRSSYDENT